MTNRIVRSAGTLTDYNVIEIGPGPGSLTRSIILKNPKNFLTIEKDHRFAKLLEDLSKKSSKKILSFSSAISNSSTDVSAGNLKTEGGDVLIRSKGQAYRKDEFANIVVKNQADGTIIRLGDIARISDDFE